MGQTSSITTIDFLKASRNGNEFLVRAVDLISLVTTNMGVIPNSKIATALSGKTYNGVTLTTAGSATKYLNEAGNYVTISGGGTGDVSGPGSSVNNNVVLFDGTTGKLIKDSGVSLSSYLTISVAAAAYQPIDSDLTTLASLAATTNNFIVSVSSAWASRTPTQVKSTLSLDLVENTALSTWSGSANIATVGTIATGSWQSSVIASTYGGTGVNNAGRTLTISTNSGTISFTTSVVLTVANTASVSGTNTGDNSANTSSQPVNSNLTTIAGLTATTDNFIVSVASAWASRTPAQVKTTLSLNLVENTALSTWTGSSNVVTVGIIGAGTWQGTLVSPTYGGTGINNAGRTLTVSTSSGTLSFTSAVTLTIAATASVSGTNTGDNAANTSSQPVNSNLTTIAGLTATTDNFIVGVASAWASRTVAQVKTTLALNNVENTALSTWTGSVNITTLGTIATGTWNATVIADGKIASALTGKTYNGVTLTTAGSSTKYLNEAGVYVSITGGTGDVVGPVSSVNNNVAFFSGTTGKIIQDSGITLSGSNTGDNAVNSLYSSLVSNATHTGDATGSTALTVVRINGVSLAGLGTGILKNTTGTGVPSIATGADFPTLNQNTTGQAATVVTNANMTGDVTSVGNVTTIKTSVILVTPVLGVATGTSFAATGAITSSGAGIGYATGAGGVATQGTSRVTTVILNKLSGTITMFSSAIAAAASSTFTFTNSFIGIDDIVIVVHNSATNACSWVCEAIAAAGSATVVVKNISAASITEATPLKFIIIKAVKA